MPQSNALALTFVYLSNEADPAGLVHYTLQNSSVRALDWSFHLKKKVNAHKY